MVTNSHYLEKRTTAYLSKALLRHFLKGPEYDELVVVGIGTCRYSGDTLGPLVGSRLEKRFGSTSGISIYGTLDKPVHSLNLAKLVSRINKEHKRPYIIAVDSCLGRYYKVGTIQLVEGALQPGASLDKQLPEIGNIHLKGIVNNFDPDLNHKVLEHTSLTFVADMAVTIADVISKSAEQLLPRIAAQAGRQAADAKANNRLSSWM
ncbi:spore protease YyaC [Paenibacillus sabinae]|uniref:Sporulation protein YyaC n=1 Tax=Paenibacillus sabinae T27 TaxID=1268072 RepID=X4ZX83_9BACL|nr:spore protease YyaC [Paenibacillus sabinae]AHV96304.1 hypothetical protein PSAB_06850 [Paenibacillus sabinae T27]